jgi:hypothetical protein
MIRRVWMSRNSVIFDFKLRPKSEFGIGNGWFSAATTQSPVAASFDPQKPIGRY